jgi:hypothetical protein
MFGQASAFGLVKVCFDFSLQFSDLAFKRVPALSAELEE